MFRESKHRTKAVPILWMFCLFCPAMKWTTLFRVHIETSIDIWINIYKAFISQWSDFNNISGHFLGISQTKIIHSRNWHINRRITDFEYILLKTLKDKPYRLFSITISYEKWKYAAVYQLFKQHSAKASLFSDSVFKQILIVCIIVWFNFYWSIFLFEVNSLTDVRN